MGTSFVFDNPDAMRSICGINDSNIPYLENLLGCSIYVRGDRVECNTEESGDPQRTSKLFIDLLDRLSRLSGITSDISEPEILMEYKSVQDALDRAADGSSEKPAKREFISVLSKAVYPKSNNQEAYIKAMNRSQITFGIGPAGTGKTYLAVAYCLGELLSGRKQKLILTNV